jgi:uncharacterized protein YutE (UPF0331/DUF86 family)
MTKQEYEAAIQSLDMELYASWLPDEGEKIAEKRHELKEQYITSLEAEVAKLNRALDVLIRCMVDVERCVCDEVGIEESECSGECSSCWREYALEEAEEEEP